MSEATNLKTDTLNDREPLAWSPTECSPDASSHLNNAQVLAQSIVAIEGQDYADSLPSGIICTMAWLLGEELDKLDDILTKGHLYAQGGAS